jgi:nitrate/nitrite transporter NarK
MPFGGGGFGPSTQRFVEVCETSEMRFKTKTAYVPSVIGVLGSVAVFFGILSGLTLIYENEEIRGAILLIAAVVLVVLMLIWTLRARRQNPDG